MTMLVVIALLIAAAVVAYTLLEKHPVYGVYYGLAKRTGSRLDIGPVDWAALTRHSTPNDALICPAAHCPNAKPDEEPKAYPLAPDELLVRVKRIALAEPDTRELPCEPRCERMARFVQYTKLMRFPDTIDLEVMPAGDGHATLALYSRSLIGRKDFGVNRARLQRWLAALDAGQIRTRA
jgi:uncharacterized protein (DUF1499 family)